MTLKQLCFFDGEVTMTRIHVIMFIVEYRLVVVKLAIRTLLNSLSLVAARVLVTLDRGKTKDLNHKFTPILRRALWIRNCWAKLS